MPRSKQEGQKRKKRVHISKEAPFPVPIASTSGEAAAPETWFYYTGYVEGSTVVVKHSGDMDFLYKMGFFGKGTMSRSQPNFLDRKQKVNLRLPTKMQKDGGQNFKTVQAALMTKRHYLVHKKFDALAEGKTEAYNEVVGYEEQQQGFADSSEEEMEDSDFEDTESDLGRAEAFRLLSSQNQTSPSVGPQSTTPPTIPNTPVNLSKYTRSYLNVMLAEIAMLSNEQITTFVHVPQSMEQLEEKFRNMRSAELNLLKQMYAAQYPGRIFKKGEVITLDEEEACPGKIDDKLENNADDAVVIMDSDEESEDKESMLVGDLSLNVKDAESREVIWDDYEEGDAEFWGTGDEEGKGSGRKNEKSGKSKKESVGTGWCSDDSGDAEFWAEGKNCCDDDNNDKSDAKSKNREKVDVTKNSLKLKKLDSNFKDSSKTSSKDLMQKNASENVKKVDVSSNEEKNEIVSSKPYNSEILSSSDEDGKSELGNSLKSKDKNQTLSDGRDEGSGKADKKDEREVEALVDEDWEMDKDLKEKTDVKTELSNNSKYVSEKSKNLDGEGNRLKDISDSSRDRHIGAKLKKRPNNGSLNDGDAKDASVNDGILNGTDANRKMDEHSNLSSDVMELPECKNVSDDHGSAGAGDSLGNLPSLFDSSVSQITFQSYSKNTSSKTDSKTDSKNQSGEMEMTVRKSSNQEVKNTFLFEASTPEADEGASLHQANTAMDVSEPDSGHSNDSDDVICIESKSAEPKKLRNFLSQQSNKCGAPVVTKSIVFMSNITSSPTYVSASVGFHSWKNVLHFNYSGDPSHLPTAMTVLPPSESENSPQIRNPQTLGMTYERIYPPVRSLVPNPGSQGAVIKQRMKGLPYLNSAYLKVASNEVASGPSVSSNNRRSLTNLNQWKTMITSAVNSAALKLNQSPSGSKNSSSWMKNTSSSLPNFLLPSPQESPSAHAINTVGFRDTSSDVSPHTLSQLHAYLRVYQLDTSEKSSSSTVTESQGTNVGKERSSETQAKQPDPSDKVSSLTESQDTGLKKKPSPETIHENPPSSLVSLSVFITKLNHLFKSIAPEANSPGAANETCDVKTLLLEFNCALSRHVTFTEISREREIKLLQLLLSNQEKTVNMVPDKLLDIKEELSPFQLWLLGKRLEHLEEYQRSVPGGSKSDNTEEMAVVDLTESSENKLEENCNAKKFMEEVSSNQGEISKTKPSLLQGGVEIVGVETVPQSNAVVTENTFKQDFRQNNSESTEDMRDQERMKRKLDDSDASEEGTKKKARKTDNSRDGETSSCGSDISDNDINDNMAKDDEKQRTPNVGKVGKIKSFSQKEDCVEIVTENLLTDTKKSKAVNCFDVSKKMEMKNVSDGSGDTSETNSKHISGRTKSVLPDENPEVPNENCDAASKNSLDSKRCDNLLPSTSGCDSVIRKQNSETDKVSEIISNSETDETKSQQNSQSSHQIEDSSFCIIDKDEPSLDNSKSSDVDKPSEKISSQFQRSEVDMTSELNHVVNIQQSQNKQQQAGSSKDFQICIDSSSDENEEEDSTGRKSHQTRSSIHSGFHPYSISDDLNGDVFVVANTSDEDEDGDEDERGLFRKRKEKWRPCLKKNPYPSQERLHLLLEEAFFLSFGLGCLRIMDPEMKVLDLTQTWQQFQVLKDHFVPQYVAYHYFRSKGWVPKSGLKFGCDWILYREGPPFFHGSYSVVVMTVSENWLLPCSRNEGFQFDHRQLNWISLAGLNRITEHVAKELMVCYVIWPNNLSKEDTLSPACISKFKVKEVVVSRWVSSQERENKNEEEAMP